jgi:hypothetical protein
MIPYLVAVAEDFVRSALVDRTEKTLPTSPPLVMTIWNQLEQDVERTWAAQERAWQDWYGVIWSKTPEYLHLEGYIEARNAIVHGLGRLTKRQTRTLGAETRTVNRLKQSDIRLDADRLIADDETVHGCAKAAVGFIGWLDRQAR